MFMNRGNTGNSKNRGNTGKTVKRGNTGNRNRENTGSGNIGDSRDRRNK